jgi:hypothetical protein
VLSAAAPVADPLPARAAAVVGAPAVTVIDWIMVSAEDGSTADPGVAAGAIAPICETVPAAALCAAAAEPDAAGPTAVELEDDAPRVAGDPAGPTAVELEDGVPRAGGDEAAGAGVAAGGRLPVGAKDAPPQTIAAAGPCAAAAGPDAAGPTAVELEDGVPRAGGEAAGAGAAAGGRMPVGGKGAPPVAAVPALPGSLLRLLLPVT